MSIDMPVTKHQTLPDTRNQSVADFLAIASVARELGLKRAILEEGPDDQGSSSRESRE
jgi:hypothetical protein